jgi:hypothetical protein
MIAQSIILPTVTYEPPTATNYFHGKSSAFAQDEEYMQEHDGGDRAEYLQEVDYDMLELLTVRSFSHYLICYILGHITVTNVHVYALLLGDFWVFKI